MSSKCIGWVYEYSPAKGATMLVHLAIADSANDQYGYELWMRQAWLAAKARVSRKSTGTALAWLADHELLLLLESGKSAGKANRYRFLMPCVEPIWQPVGTQPVPTQGTQPVPKGAQPVPKGAQPGDTPVRNDYAHNPSVNPNQPKPTTDARPDALAGFDDFWAAYPRRVAKGAARKAWPTAVKAAGSDPAVVIAGARAYHDSPDREPAYTAHPATWLRAERWTDEPPPEGQRRGVVAPTTNRPTQGAKLDL